jgi:hypothetical protein
MSTKRASVIIIVASIVLLVIAFGPRIVGAAQAFTLDQKSDPGYVTIPHSGRMSDATGQPVSDGAYSFVFALYPNETGGELLWSEAQEGVAVKDGLFNASLGNANPILDTLLDGHDLWLSTSVRGPGDTEFTALNPRQRLSAVSPAASASITAGTACAHDHWGEIWSGWTGPGDGFWLKGNVNWSSGIFLVDNNGTGPSIWGYNNGGGNAVRGDAEGPNSLGVYGSSEQSTGVVGRSGTGRGVEGYSTDGYGVFAHSDSSHSIYVDGAGGNGVDVESATGHGVYVASAGWDGVAVWSATVAGMYVHSAGADGILVDTATWDGVHVVGPVGGVYYGSGKKGAEDFAVLNTGEVRSKVGFATPSNGFAVIMPINGVEASYEYGDVLVLGDAEKQRVTLTSTPYSPAVIGVYSASPGFVSGQPVPPGKTADGIPVTILGIVSVKVSAENGLIRVGDLLVTSTTPGYAMRGDNPPAGTVLGKALGSLDSGSGIIMVLLMLQ